VELATEKWGGRSHYRGDNVHLGDDEHGTWLWGAAGRTIYRDDEPLFVTEHDALTLVPPGRWWAPSWWIGHPELEVYVNINTPAERRGDRIVWVDLDLDVIRFRDGRVEVVDRDEFEEHQVRYGYPGDLIARAEAVTAEAHELVTRNVPPFDGLAAAGWIARARAGDGGA
jgi:uncharacterized protein